uniref:uncharacterized protein LOC117608887 n=1 Tax=Osmia lignaria TaxID=473952 RepID=UPI00147884A5|nr:uncharacterized protein LOC117608887 [Osmia lignaria]
MCSKKILDISVIASQGASRFRNSKVQQLVKQNLLLFTEIIHWRERCTGGAESAEKRRRRSRWRQRKTSSRRGNTGEKIAARIVSKIETASLTLCYKLSASLCSL